MAQPLGSRAAVASSTTAGPQVAQSPVFVAAKTKSCKQRKCSNWKGGKCRCGRD